MKSKKLICSIITFLSICMMQISANAAVSYVPNYDVNHDGVVNVRDVAYINRVINGGAKPTSIDNLDANKNGVVDDIDVKTILYHVTNKKFTMTMQWERYV